MLHAECDYVYNGNVTFDSLITLEWGHICRYRKTNNNKIKGGDEMENISKIIRRIFNSRNYDGKFTIYKDKAGEFRFNLKGKNNKIVCSGEGYKTKRGCLAGVNVIKKMAKHAEIIYE